MAGKKNDRISEIVRKRVEAELKKSGIILDGLTILYAMQGEDDEKDGHSDQSELEVSSLSSSDKTVNTSSQTKSVRRDGDFWDLGKPEPRNYSKPDFSPEALSLSEVEQTEEKSGAHLSEAIPKRDEGYVSQTMNPFTSLPGKKVVTHSYKKQPKQKAPKKEEPVKDSVYEINGALIHKITVRGMNRSGTFYTRFASDAASGFDTPSTFPTDSTPTPVQFYSYFPQYSHMTRAQLDYYRWIRANIREGRYPDCDMAYIMLFICEVLNLDGLIPPQTGVIYLTSVWLGYRQRYLALDMYLGEWLPDYCMIHNLPLPGELYPLLSTIVPKVSFKEFYLNDILSHPDDGDNLLLAAKILIANSSDYDFTQSRYYPENREKYEKYIPLALSEVLKKRLRERSGCFSFDKTYKLTRDSYKGAIVSSGAIRWIEIEFSSFLRGLELRTFVTNVVKYSENVLRRTLGIKAKLMAKNIDPHDIEVIERFFEPMLPVKEKKKKSSEDRYMPADYLKNYEAETSGFDFASAAEIERLSWENTERLTSTDSADSAETDTAPDEECERLEGELSVAEVSFESIDKAVPDVDDKAAAKDKEENDQVLRDAVAAALRGELKKYAHEKGIYEGELQDRINSLFLDIIGDVILEDCTLIEDYREDVEEWMK